MEEVKRSFWDFAWLTGATVLAVPLMLLSESIQARQLGPAFYGKTGLILSAIALLYLGGLNWLRTAVLRFGKQEFTEQGHLRTTTGNFVLLTIASFVVCSSLFYAFKSPILRFLEIRQSGHFWVIIAGLAVTAVREFVFETLKAVRKINAQSVLQRLFPKIWIVLGMVGAAWIMGYLSVETAVAVFISADAATVIAGLFFIKRSYLWPLSFSKPLLTKMFWFSFPLLFSSWSQHLINWVDMYVIKYYLDMDAVGIYQAAYKVFNTLRSFSSSTLVTLFTPIIIVLRTRGQQQKVKHLYFERLLPQVTFFATVATIAGLMACKPGFDLVYGARFTGAVAPFLVLGASLPFYAMLHTIIPVITAWDLTRLMLWVSLSSGLYNLVADLLLVNHFGIMGASWASYTVFAFTPIVWYALVGKRLGSNLRKALLYPWFALLAALAQLLLPVWIAFFSNLALVVALLILARYTKLFTRHDEQIISNISMPEWMQKAYFKLIGVFGKA